MTNIDKREKTSVTAAESDGMIRRARRAELCAGPRRPSPA